MATDGRGDAKARQVSLTYVLGPRIGSRLFDRETINLHRFEVESQFFNNDDEAQRLPVSNLKRLLRWLWFIVCFKRADVIMLIVW